MNRQYLEQPRGTGTAWRFRMKTPKNLIGAIAPWSGKPLGTWIIRPLGGVTELRKAMLGRDLALSEVRKLEALTLGQERFSRASAERWQEAMQAGSSGDADETLVRDLLYDEIERAPEDVRKGFARAALATSLSVQSAVDSYLADRKEGNAFGYKPIAPASANELRTAVKHLAAHLERADDNLYLDDITPEFAQTFRGDYLARINSARGKPMASATIDKYMTLLRGLWRWAITHGKATAPVNPFDLQRGIPRAKRKSNKDRDMYSPEQAVLVCGHLPAGHRMGDLFRLGLATGARLSEIAKLECDNVHADGRAFVLTGGKTENARRVVPVPAVVRNILLARVRSATEQGEKRAFHEFPLSPSTGNAKSASQAFSRVRSDVFGKEAAASLDFHSLRHTWRTMARRAGLTVDDTHDIGGWAAVSKSSNPYDHGLDLDALLGAQDQVAALMSEKGYFRSV